ncbi:hypothetical protein PYW08_011481 [Mythimna loreyi]|uniref:Uncharacterized protein n=1 Tax=Mythimna loreyi TaxID=667449 RepID=A0ACC2QK20_9NEOP|nr:hypothetical protein PYW08_011481 [Mythimna loreyi]
MYPHQPVSYAIVPLLILTALSLLNSPSLYDFSESYKMDTVSPLPACTAPEAPPQLEKLPFSDTRYYSMYPHQQFSYAAAVVPSYSISPDSIATLLLDSPDFYNTESSEDQEYLAPLSW